MNSSHTTKYPQLPGNVVKVVYSGTDFVCKSGKVLKVRKVDTSTGADTLTLFVPAKIVRDNQPASYTGNKGSKWILQINGVTLYFKDRDGSPVESLLAAVEVLYNMEDAPISVLQTLKTEIKKERQRKNVNTGVPGITIHSTWNRETKLLSYDVRCSIQFNGTRYVKQMAFDWQDGNQLYLALSVMTSFRQHLLQTGITDPKEADALLAAMKRGLISVRSYNVTAKLTQQIEDNVTMRMAMLTGKGWTNPYNGEHIASY